MSYEPSIEIVPVTIALVPRGTKSYCNASTVVFTGEGTAFKLEFIVISDFKLIWANPLYSSFAPRIVISSPTTAGPAYCFE